MPAIAETAVEMIEWVFPEHAGAPGQIHGGRMMEWIAKAGTMAAARVARGHVALGAMDDIDFLHPVRIGDIAILRAQVEYVGRSSLEVGVRVWAENVATGRRAVTLNSHLVFVKVGDDLSREARTFLSSLKRVAHDAAPVTVPYPNNRVELRYIDDERRSEKNIDRPAARDRHAEELEACASHPIGQWRFANPGSAVEPRRHPFVVFHHREDGSVDAMVFVRVGENRDAGYAGRQDHQREREEERQKEAATSQGLSLRREKKPSRLSGQGLMSWRNHSEGISRPSPFSFAP